MERRCCVVRKVGWQPVLRLEHISGKCYLKVCILDFFLWGYTEDDVYQTFAERRLKQRHWVLESVLILQKITQPLFLIYIFRLIQWFFFHVLLQLSYNRTYEEAGGLHQTENPTWIVFFLWSLYLTFYILPMIMWRRVVTCYDIKRFHNPRWQTTALTRPQGGLPSWGTVARQNTRGKHPRIAWP